MIWQYYYLYSVSKLIQYCTYNFFLKETDAVGFLILHNIVTLLTAMKLKIKTLATVTCALYMTICMCSQYMIWHKKKVIYIYDNLHWVK